MLRIANSSFKPSRAWLVLSLRDRRWGGEHERNHERAYKPEQSGGTSAHAGTPFDRHQGTVGTPARAGSQFILDVEPAARNRRNRLRKNASMLSSLKALLSTDNDPAERVVPSHLFALEGAWSYSQGVSHSFCDPREGDHDIVALTPCWSDLDPTLDLDTFLCAAARGTPPRPDAAPPLLSLWHVPSALAAGRTTG